MKLFEISFALTLIFGVIGCSSGSDGPKTPLNLPENAACNDDSECRSRICLDGTCTLAEVCAQSADCGGGQYCHFPTLTSGWQAGTQGLCQGPCSGDPDCESALQVCHEFQSLSRCYTKTPCNPANLGVDCPPGEVCDRLSSTCLWPPESCYFNEQCPAGWMCDPNGLCIDPNLLGECNRDSDCVGKPGCDGGCVCFDRACTIESVCERSPQGDAACGLGKYCARGACQEATGCANGQNDCTPYGLVCRAGYCGNPEACSPDGNCPENLECKTNFTPPACFPPDVPDCTRDEMCPVGTFCEFFSGQCQVGCRQDGDCVASCPGASFCTCGQATNCDYCNGQHACSDTPTNPVGGPCKTAADCSGGAVCVVDVPGIMGILCQLDTRGIIPNCSKSCYLACDLLTSAVNDTCPAGYSCGRGELSQDLLEAIFGSAASNSISSAAVCYPSVED